MSITPFIVAIPEPTQIGLAQHRFVCVQQRQGFP